MTARSRKRFASYVRNYAWAVGTTFVYASCSYLWEQYVAIVAANVVFFGLFTLFDYGSYLKLDSMKIRRDHLVNKNVETVQDEAVVVLQDVPTGKIVLNVSPSCFIKHTEFYSAFKLSYLVDDTSNFIASFSANIRLQFFITFFVAFLLFVAFGANHTQGPASASALVQPVSEVDKVIVTTAATIINVLIFLRLFLYFGERNRSVLQA
jgi:hypothetical protein